MKADLVGVIEASYLRSADAQEWLSGVLRSIQPLFDTGGGVVGLVISESLSASPNVRAVASENLSESLASVFGRVTDISTNDETRRRFQGGGPVGMLSRTLGDAFYNGRGHGELVDEAGLSDAEYIVTGAFDDLCCVIAAGRMGRAARPRHERRTLERLAAHIASGSRLAWSGQQGADPFSSAEAVLDPDGKVQDAQGDAKHADVREALRSAAKLADRARGGMRKREPEEAVAIWSALVAGRWSLVDHFDSDGRRFLIARPNEGTAPRGLPLTPRESQVVALAAAGHSNKLIAYELGLAVATVATHLMRAQAKLGVRSRVELIKLFPSTAAAP